MQNLEVTSDYHSNTSKKITIFNLKNGNKNSTK